MIFVTVGAQLPFDRLLKAVDSWAKNNPNTEVFAQINKDAWQPQHLEFTEFLDAEEFRSNIERCDGVVAHAGMGSILTALELAKPILVLPRRGHLNETRNDHQVATAQKLQELGMVKVAENEEALPPAMDILQQSESSDKISKFASGHLIEAIQDFLAGLKS